MFLGDNHEKNFFFRPRGSIARCSRDIGVVAIVWFTSWRFGWILF